MKIDQKSRFSQALSAVLSELGQALRAHRLVLRMTHEHAAQVCGFSRQTLSRIERGDPSVAVGQIVRYADVLGARRLFAVKVPARAEPDQKRVRLRRSEREQGLA